MKIFTEPFPHIGEPFAVCIGKFDGVHTGHRRILETLLGQAKARRALAVAYSFEPRNGAPRLTTAEEKAALLEEMGIGVLIAVDLTENFMAQSARAFIERLATCGGLAAVVVGEGFRYGAGAQGDVTLLREMGRAMDFGVHAIEQVQVGGRPVSSTAIRECLAAGQVERAALLLGREYALTGQVVPGRKLARELGFPTANLLPPANKAMPANGVYATWVETEQGIYPAMTNIGVKPTINGSELLIESHLIGFDGDLYGKTITVRLAGRIRDEIKFDTLEKLQEQMQRDRSTAEKLLI
jgi:riboflavin kinase / FMN adenylyltransferase